MKRARNRLRVLRAERRLTQLRLGLRAGLATSRISLIENGHMPPSENERQKLARFFKVPITDIFPDYVADESVAS